MEWNQKESWSILKYAGDWVIEERRSNNPSSQPRYELCIMNERRVEESIELPSAIVDACRKANVPIAVSEGWEF